MKFFDIHTHSPSEQAICSCTMKDSLAPVDKGFRSVGIHPWHLDQLEKQFQWLEEAVCLPDVKAVGECGLDKLVESSMELQMEVFRKCALLSERMHLPLVIHAVRCTEQLLGLKQAIRPEMPWIVHGFRGKPALAAEYLRHGFYLSFGAKFQDDSLRLVPVEKLLLETDDSDRCIQEVYQQAAHVRGISPEELADSIRKNVKKVFFKP